MPSLASLRRMAVCGLTGLALAATAAGVSTATAAAHPADAVPTPSVAGCFVGLVTNVNQNTWVRRAPGFTDVLYTIPDGGGFRITGGPGFADGLWWWQGNGNGQSTGWAPAQNLTCNS